MRITRLCMYILLGLLLCACVTETSGGFKTEPSESAAFETYIELSNGYLQQDDLVNTRRHLNNAMEINPNDSDLHGVWALLYTREGDMDLAEKSFERGLRLDPENSRVRNNYAAFLFSVANYAKAYQQLEKVVSDTEYNARPQAFENMGLAALNLNNTTDAENAFKRALQLNSNQLRSNLELVDINLDKGDVLQARSYYRNFLTIVQFYNMEHNARSLWAGIQLEMALGNENNVTEYAQILERKFNDSTEFRLYQKTKNAASY